MTAPFQPEVLSYGTACLSWSEFPIYFEYFGFRSGPTSRRATDTWLCEESLGPVGPGPTFLTREKKKMGKLAKKCKNCQKSEKNEPIFNFLKRSHWKPLRFFPRSAARARLKSCPLIG
eukprot:sb/3476429/